MTKPTKKPEHIELITRKQFSRIAKINVARINKISLTEDCKFPQPVCRFAHNEIAYNKEELLDWLEKSDIKEMSKLATIKYCGDRESNKIKQQLPKMEPAQKLDNHLALAFLTRKLIVR